MSYAYEPSMIYFFRLRMFNKKDVPVRILFRGRHAIGGPESRINSDSQMRYCFIWKRGEAVSTAAFNKFKDIENAKLIFLEFKCSDLRWDFHQIIFIRAWKCCFLFENGSTTIFRLCFTTLLITDPLFTNFSILLPELQVYSLILDFLET